MTSGISLSETLFEHLRKESRVIAAPGQQERKAGGTILTLMATLSLGDRDIRDASQRDAEACAAIYAPYVTDTAISFELDPPAPDEMAERIATASSTHAWLVLEHEFERGLERGRRVAGFAYARPVQSPGGRIAGRVRSASISSRDSVVRVQALRSTTRSSRGWPSAASAPPSQA